MLTGMSLAQLAPGEDPMVINQKIQRNMVPMNTGMSTPQPAFQEIPAWMDAKLARFQAKIDAENARRAAERAKLYTVEVIDL